MPTPLFIEFERKQLVRLKGQSRILEGIRIDDQVTAEEAAKANKSLGVSLIEQTIPESFKLLRLNGPTVAAIAKTAGVSVTTQTVTSEDIAASKAFVEKLFDVNLQGVTVNVVDEPHRDDVEGFYLSCDREDGEVFVPSSFQSPRELIVHELGHAAHHNLRRQSNEAAFWIGSPLEAELCAYFAQLNYLLVYGSRLAFYKALGALATATAYLAVANAVSHKMPLRKFLRSAEFSPYDLSSTRDFVLGAFEDDKDRANQQVRIRGGFGFALALKLVDEHDGMRRFARTDSSSVSIRKKLTTCFPHRPDVFDLSNTPAVIASLSERFK